MGKTRPLRPESSSIQSLTVEGFKSIDVERTIDIRPLTILAGANSSGKSSIIQPLLLLKQTLEAPYDPGPLLLNGPNVKFTAVSQFLPKTRRGPTVGTFSFGVAVALDSRCRIFFRKTNDLPVDLERVEFEWQGSRDEFKPGEVDISQTPFKDDTLVKSLVGGASVKRVRFTRNRCFIDASLLIDGSTIFPLPVGNEQIVDAISRIIHIPGLRGNPQRTYPLTAIGDRFPGRFDEYVASVIASAQPDVLQQLGDDLQALGLTWKVQARNVDETQVELQVGRLPKSAVGGEMDLVSIADVGFGVSQTLPVVVALLIAKPGQFVYIEQPEIHLHPRAQAAMAGLLARAANRGVRVVVETHSSLLLLGIQQLIAEDTLDPANVRLHWFKRDDTGATNITTAELDAAGTLGDWPVDFDDVSLDAQKRFLDAAEKKLAP